MNEEIGILDYRLKSIESELKELKELLVEVPILSNTVQSLEHRISACESNLDTLTMEVSKLKSEPLRHNAEKWKTISDYIFKAVVAVIIGYVFTKIGLE